MRSTGSVPTTRRTSVRVGAALLGLAAATAQFAIAAPSASAAPATSAAAPAAAGAPFRAGGVVEASGQLDVFSRAANGDLVRSYLSPSGTWAEYDLTVNGAAPALGGNPVADVRPDGTLDVFYRDVNGHLSQSWLSPGTTAWQTVDFSATGRAPQSITGDPAVLVHPDTVSVYTADSAGDLNESYLKTGQPWVTWDMTKAGVAGSVTGQVATAVRPDGTLDLFYRGGGGNLEETYGPSNGSSWQHWTFLSRNTGSWQPSAVTGTPSIVIDPATGSEHLFVAAAGSGDLLHAELPTSGGWLLSDLTAAGAATTLAGSPSADIRPTGTIDVFYRAAPTDHLYQTYYGWNGGSSWAGYDLSAGYGPAAIAGDPSAVLEPRSKALHVFARAAAVPHLIGDALPANSVWRSTDLTAGGFAPVLGGN
ncbi:hypothetical protein AB0O91_37510 [Kitasatospora sp. NPDC089797]|uniref:hypothetical protein n=1 Tax=Kitasatospora sp. NPDC089797 TaxID=3155298 RepID=UPI003432B51C